MVARMAFELAVAAVAACSMYAVLVHVEAMPQGAEKYEPYEYKYEVKDPEKKLFFDKNEAGDMAGKVTGRYSVWLPDGRLMTIKYIVDKEGGFQPEVDFQDNANPLSG
ncbi:pro-resilin-like [Anopheles cruzii]|uniref:pro-resilin-like n=1 Tax=Anopheles cruzii TaxID=68878 RepID=UPI0022EC26D7|nr:pro-resilin-like [Anopheles cruzii]